MAFKVSEFISNLRYDGARPNLFEVRMPFPTAVPDQGYIMQFMARAASLPSSLIGVAEVPYFGRQVKLMGNRTFDDWTVTVINDEDFIIRDSFEIWSNNINSHNANLLLGAYDNVIDYSVNATIIQYDKHNISAKEYVMFGAWPSAVSAIDMSWDTNNVVEEFSVTFQYQWWSSNTATD